MKIGSLMPEVILNPIYTSSPSLFTVGSEDLLQINNTGSITHIAGLTFSGSAIFSVFLTSKALLFTKGSGQIL